MKVATEAASSASAAAKAAAKDAAKVSVMVRVSGGSSNVLFLTCLSTLGVGRVFPKQVHQEWAFELDVFKRAFHASLLNGCLKCWS